MVAVPYMSIDLRRKGIKNYNKIISSLRRNLLIKMKVFGNAAERDMRKRLKSGKYAENSPPWAKAKGGGKVLYNTGHLSTKIKNRVIPGVGPVFVSVEVGFLDNTKHPNRQSKGSIQDIAKFLTGNQSWEPKRSSVKAFWAKVPKEWKAANPPLFKDTWTSPERDFVKGSPYDHAATIALLHKHLDHAIRRAMEGK